MNTTEDPGFADDNILDELSLSQEPMRKEHIVKDKKETRHSYPISHWTQDRLLTHKAFCTKNLYSLCAKGTDSSVLPPSTLGHLTQMPKVGFKQR